MKTLWSIQALRAFAALSVAFYHACQWGDVLPFPTGAAGVDIFFVVSGFVMWLVAEAAPVSPLEFLRRRAVRILPPYWIVSGAALGLALWLPGIIQTVVTGGPRHWLLSLFLIPHRDPHGEPFPLLKPGWTLEFEALFYLVFAAVLLVPRARRIEVLTAAMIVLGLTGFFWPQVMYLANPLQFEFLAGVWIARFHLEGRLPGPKACLGLIVAALAILAALQSRLFDDYHWRWLLWGAPAAMIVLACVALEPRTRLFRSRVLQVLGDGSYSLYLAHPLAIEATARVIDPIANFWLFLPVAMAAAIAVGLACRAWVEKPLLRLMRGKPRRVEA